jgi:hypothetical protein
MWFNFFTLYSRFSFLNQKGDKHFSGGCQKYSTSRKRKFCSQFSFLFLNPFKNCMFSSCYHAFLGVAIFIFIKRSKIIKLLVWLPESIYIKKKIQKPYFWTFWKLKFYAFSRGCLYLIFHSNWSEFSITTPMDLNNAYIKKRF